MGYEIIIQGWGAAEGGTDEFYSNASDSALIDFGNGCLFQLRLARYGPVALETSEENGDLEMSPLEFQLVCKRDDGALDSQRWPPHFRLFAYQCAAPRRAPSGNYEEILDSANARTIRDADHFRFAIPESIALAFTLPGRGAGCEDIGISHELL